MKKTIKKIQEVHEEIKPIIVGKMTQFQKVREWLLNHFFTTFLILLIINIFFFINRSISIVLDILAFALLIIYIIAYMVGRIQKNIHKLVHHELTFNDIVKVYLSSALFIMLLFSILYWGMTAVGTGYLKYGTCTDNVEITPDLIVHDELAVRDITQYSYFSAITFFTVGFGDICPMGMSKIVAILNAVIGHAFTVLILSIAITNYASGKDDDDKKKKKLHTKNDI
jgi:hypothetical protein